MQETISRENLIEEFVASMKSNRATMFIGAGLSVASGYPTWDELLSTAAKKMGININQKSEYSYYDFANWYCQFNNDRTSLVHELVRKIDVIKDISDNHQIIARLPLSKIWTTNFDTLIERSLIQARKTVKVISRDKDFSFNNSEETTLYKAHGCISRPDDVVITGDDIDNYYRKYEVMLDTFFSALSQESFLFLGFSFNDINFKKVLGRVFANFKDLPKRHYAILKEPHKKIEMEVFQFFVNDLSKKGIKVHIIKEYWQIPILLKDIEKTYLRNNIFICGSFSTNYIDRHKNESIYIFKLDEYNAVIRSAEISPLESTKDEIRTEYEQVFNKVHPYTKAGRESFNSFLELVGTEIAKQGLKIFTGYGLGVCDIIVESACKSMVRKNMPSNEILRKLNIIPLPHSRNVEYFHNRFYRETMIGSCGFMLVARGATHYSDYTSGAFEEYNIAKGLSNLLTGRQKRLFLELKTRYEHFDFVNFSVASNTTELSYKLIEAGLYKDVKPGEPEITRFLITQEGLIRYKYQELSEIFYRLFYEQWKIVIRTIDVCKYRIVILAQHLEKDISIGLSSSLNKLRKYVEDLVLIRNKYFYAKFNRIYCDETPIGDEADFFNYKLILEKIDNKKKEIDLDGFLTLYKTLKDNLDKVIKNPETSSPKLINIAKTIVSLLHAVTKLLKGDYKYSILDFFIFELEKQETFCYISNENAKKVEYLEKYKNAFKVFLEFINKYDEIDQRSGDQTGDDINHPPNSEGEKIQLEALFEESYFDVTQFKTHDRTKKATVDGLFSSDKYVKDLIDHYLKSMNDNGILLGFEKAKLEHIILKIQFYKILYLLTDFDKSFRRLESNLKILQIELRDRKNEELLEALQREKEPKPGVPETDPDRNVRKDSKYKSSEEASSTDPLLLDPNDLERHIILHKKYLNYYISHDSLLKLMLEVLHSLVKLSKFLEQNKKQEDKNLKSKIHICLSEIESANDEIDKIEKSNKIAYEKSPYRSGTVVIPIASFGGMAKKIWKEERVRFEFLCNTKSFLQQDNADTNISIHQKLMNCFDKLYSVDCRARENETDGYNDLVNGKITELVEAVIYIIKIFQNPPKDYS